MDIDFEKICNISVTAMRISRSHPEVPRDIKWLLQFGIMHGIFTVQYLIMAHNIILAIEAGDYTDACRNGVASVLYWVVTFQYFNLVVKHDTITKIMDMMNADFQKNLPDDEKNIVMEYAKKGSAVCYLWFVIVVITGAVFPIKLAVLELYLYVKGEFQQLMMFPLVFPSPIDEHKMQPFVYTLVTALMLYYETYSCCVYIGFVPLGPAFMLHACGQLEIIKKRALNLYVNSSSEDTKEKLIEIVKHLQHIYTFVEYINDIFRVIYEITMKGSTILLPITSYQVLQSFHHGELSVEFLGFIFAGAVISSLPCYYSDMLIKKGDDVRLAIYSCGWETVFDHGTRTTILLMLQRALRPCSIRTMFRTMCLEALTHMFQQSYAILNLMNAAWG